MSEATVPEEKLLKIHADEELLSLLFRKDSFSIVEDVSFAIRVLTQAKDDEHSPLSAFSLPVELLNRIVFNLANFLSLLSR